MIDALIRGCFLQIGVQNKPHDGPRFWRGAMAIFNLFSSHLKRRILFFIILINRMHTSGTLSINKLNTNT